MNDQAVINFSKIIGEMLSEYRERGGGEPAILLCGFPTPLTEVCGLPVIRSGRVPFTAVYIMSRADYDRLAEVGD